MGEVVIGQLELGFLKGLIHAERWRKLHREDPDATIDIYEEFDATIEALNFLRDKLEAVKNHFNLVNKHRNDRNDLPKYHAYRHVLNSIWFTELGEILEDVDIDEETI